jgi:hypothetical protein
MSYLNEEVNCTEAFPSVSIPWLISSAVDKIEIKNVLLSVAISHYADCHYVKCHYAECRGAHCIHQGVPGFTPKLQFKHY